MAVRGTSAPLLRIRTNTSPRPGTRNYHAVRSVTRSPCAVHSSVHIASYRCCSCKSHKCRFVLPCLPRNCPILVKCNIPVGLRELRCAKVSGNCDCLRCAAGKVGQSIKNRHQSGSRELAVGVADVELGASKWCGCKAVAVVEHVAHVRHIRCVE